VLAVYEIGNLKQQNIKTHALTLLVESLISGAAFDQLRTKEQLGNYIENVSFILCIFFPFINRCFLLFKKKGYIVFAYSKIESDSTAYMHVLLESSDHKAYYLSSRIEAFMER
jgi:secreted Zn-dependent insulinase-like peptidase